MKLIQTTAAAALLTTAALVPAHAQSATDACNLLKDNGLVAKSRYYVLDAEIKLGKEYEAVRRAKSALDRIVKKHKRSLRQIEQVKTKIASMRAEKTALERQARLSSRDSRRVAELGASLRKYNEALRQYEAKYERTYKPARKTYVDMATKLNVKVVGIAAKYAELAKQADVRKALAKLRSKLGPMPTFNSRQKSVAKWFRDIEQGIIKLDKRPGGNTFKIQVSIQGRAPREMTLDTGAGVLCLPYNMARNLGITIGPGDRKATAVLADGKRILCTVKYLKSVKVGDFTVKNVECFVMPKELTNASALLGMSFLQKFNFRIDTASGELHLTPKPGAGVVVGASK